jgi:amino acid transporter
MSGATSVVMTERNHEHERLYRAWRRWHWATAAAAAWMAVSLALLPFGPDLLVFILAIAPTDRRTLLVTVWIVMIVIAVAVTAVFAVKRHRARQRARAAGVELKRSRR